MIKRLTLLAALVLLACAAAGCRSTIKGGSRLEASDHNTVTTGEERREDTGRYTRLTPFQEQVLRDAMFQISPEGMITVRFGKSAATTQPSVVETREESHVATTRPTVTETTHTVSASTQPSVTTDGKSGMKFDHDGNVTSVWFEPGQVVENLKARALMITPLVLGALVFFWFKRWLGGGACLAAAAVVALVSQWLVDVAFFGGLAGGVGFLVYEVVVKHKTIQQLRAGAASVLGSASG